MNETQLAMLANTLVSDGRGLLAADESEGTIGKRLQAAGIDNTADIRRAFRELLFTTPGLEEAISGIILHEESLGQASASGERFLDILAGKSIVPGLKLDKGLVDLPCRPGERLTQGLDGLRERLSLAQDHGIQFAKWREVYRIGIKQPSLASLRLNAVTLATYAAYCQEAGIVPVVEPEVLMTGDHDLSTCAVATEAALHMLFETLREFGVMLEGLLLKCNMVLPGERCPGHFAPEAVAIATLDTLSHAVPAAVPGIVFLSGGQAAELATHHLNAINTQGRCAWALSFSFARALSEPVLHAWRGRPDQVRAAQTLLHHRAMCNREARFGRYEPEIETIFARNGVYFD